MKQRPILFSGPMVLALLNGSKTQTRRVVMPQPANGWDLDGSYGCITSPHKKKDRFGAFIRHGLDTYFPLIDLIPCPYGQPGDQLWVRETWWLDDEDNSIIYKADANSEIVDVTKHETGLAKYNWRPSIFMPRAASRITLEIVSILVERLQDISRGDAMLEGYPFPNLAQGDDPRRWYADLWTQINGPGSWAENPWVWVVQFKEVST